MLTYHAAPTKGLRGRLPDRHPLGLMQLPCAVRCLKSLSWAKVERRTLCPAGDPPQRSQRAVPVPLQPRGQGKEESRANVADMLPAPRWSNRLISRAPRVSCSSNGDGSTTAATPASPSRRSPSRAR